MTFEIDLFSPYFVILQENEHGDPQLFLLHLKEQPLCAINDKYLHHSKEHQNKDHYGKLAFAGHLIK